MFHITSPLGYAIFVILDKCLVEIYIALSDSEKISGDLLISFDRVGENAGDLGVGFQEELRRVIIHGVLHLVGLKDKSEKEAKEMRACENAALKMFHVEP